MDDLAERIDGVAQALMLTIAALEDRGALDGAHLTAWMRDTAAVRRRLGFPASECTLLDIAQRLDDRRASRPGASRP